jgi:Na+-translocating ferredoxin:NAD+ oxidoreductase subunit E
MKTIYSGIIKENAIFSLALGLCTALALSNNFESAYIMGLCVMLVLIFSNVTVSLIRNLIPDNVKIPVFILIIGTFVTITEILVQSYIPDLHRILGIYLPLIVVNCIVLGRALSVASKKDVLTSLKDAFGIGIGYLVSIMIIALVREIIGNGTLTIMDSLSSLTGYRIVYQIYPDMNVLPFKVLKEPAGAFITLGFLMALFKAYVSKERAKDVTH